MSVANHNGFARARPPPIATTGPRIEEASRRLLCQWTRRRLIQNARLILKKKRETNWRVVQLVVLSLWIFAVFPEINAQTAILDEAVIERAHTYEPSIRDAASSHGVDARLLWVIAYLETRFSPSLVSRKGARGMMQFMPNTAERFGLANPHDPIAAIDAAARYVRFLADRFGNRAELILAAYNSGETTVEAYLTGHSIKVGDKVINPKGVITG